MTTHFTSGVTNVVTGGTGEKLKQPDPIKYHVYHEDFDNCLLYTSPSPRDRTRSRMPSSA